MTMPSVDELFEVMSRASTGDSSARVALDASADPTVPMTRLALALNVLLDDLDYRGRQAQSYLVDMLDQRTHRLRASEAEVKRRDEFISIAGHELNTPLMSLRLALEGLRLGIIGSTPTETQRAIEMAQRQVNKLAALVKQLLGVGRARMLPLQLSDVDVVALVREVAELATPELTSSGSTLSVHAEGPVIGRWDRRRLEHVFSNLLANAIKFGKGNPIDIMIGTVGASARLTVVDRGIGIQSDRLPFVFERFERAVSSAHYGGLGLGLFIVREVVLEHQGRVTVESSYGQGTSFIVELPLSGPRASETDDGNGDGGSGGNR